MSVSVLIYCYFLVCMELSHTYSVKDTKAGTFKAKLF